MTRTRSILAVVVTPVAARERPPAPTPGPFRELGIEIDDAVDCVRSELLRYRPTLSHHP